VRNGIIALVAALTAGIVLAGAAIAGKPGSASSTGTASVFGVNPVQSTGNEALTDQNDSDAAVPSTAYYNVKLTNLDGSGFLSGDYATIASETGNPAYSPSNTFVYTRHQDEFEQVMAYYWITEAQKYIHSLGFGENGKRGINNRPQPVRINQWGLDNSFATDHPKNELRFGKGGVDDAEDAEVILHEYGHAIHFSQNFSFATEEAGAISEGFGDYWAVTVSDVVARAQGFPAKTPLPCVADWDSTSYTSAVPHCLRRVDLNLHYPESLRGEVHADGEIWSRALWDIRNALGNVKADTVILTGSFDFDGSSFATLAKSTVAAAKSLYGATDAAKVQKAFADRGIL
jgi:zinc metalloprotease ZmpB